MGQITRELAKVTEPQFISLAGNSNFVIFEKIDTENSSSIPNRRIHFSLELLHNGLDESEILIEFVETKSKTIHRIMATRDKNLVNDTTCFLDDDISVTTENLKECLCQDLFFSSNFEITIPIVKDGNNFINGTVIHIISKDKDGCKTFERINYNPLSIKIEGNYSESSMSDSILAEDEACEIRLDIYDKIGELEEGFDLSMEGSYMATLSKMYMGKPVWFDLNTVWTNRNIYSDDFLEANGWCSAGTVSDFRFVAKKYNGYNNEVFYHSDVLSVITGSGNNLDKNNLSSYIFDVNNKEEIVKPLTNQPVLTYIVGQKQYFNFILSPSAKIDKAGQNMIGLMYKFYTSSGGFLGSKVFYEQSSEDFDVVNTIGLDFDSLISAYPSIGIIKVFLCCNGVECSVPLVYTILPQSLYQVNDFVFLNSLGGWSSFNWGGTQSADFKTDSISVFRTRTPHYATNDPTELMFNKEVTEQFTVQTMPVTKEIAEWLKEMSSSIAVYEASTKRYIIVEELNIKHNSKDDLFVLQMKYHYSESFN